MFILSRCFLTNYSLWRKHSDHAVETPDPTLPSSDCHLQTRKTRGHDCGALSCSQPHLWVLPKTHLLCHHRQAWEVTQARAVWKNNCPAFLKDVIVRDKESRRNRQVKGEWGDTAGDECHEGGDWDIGQSHDVTPGVILLDCNATFPEHDAAVAVSWKIFS